MNPEKSAIMKTTSKNNLVFVLEEDTFYENFFGTEKVAVDKTNFTRFIKASHLVENLKLQPKLVVVDFIKENAEDVYGMPIKELITELRSQNVAILVTTNLENHDLAVKLLKENDVDFLLKDTSFIRDLNEKINGVQRSRVSKVSRLSKAKKSLKWSLGISSLFISVWLLLV